LEDVGISTTQQSYKLLALWARVANSRQRGILGSEYVTRASGGTSKH